jgi:hypothetical protein
MKRFGRKLRNFFFPTAANGYHPGIFTKEAVIGILAILLFLQIGYFAFVTVVLHRTNFLAAVLPGVLTALTNADRAQNGAGTLTENPLLDKAAQASVDDMAAKGYFSHTTPDGKTPWYWLDQAGYRYTYAGQNLAVDFTDSKDVENAWMNSPTHRANIVKPEFTEVGIAVANGTYEGKPATFVVQFFGTPASAAAPLPKPVATVPKESEGNVLGAETAPSPAPAEKAAAAPASAPEASAPATALAVAATSPDHLLLFITGGILGLIALLFAIAIFVKVRIQHLSVIAGGLVLIAAAGASFLISGTRVSNPAAVPSDTGTSTVYIGFTGQ